MRPSRPLVHFACFFALIYGALIVPWPGWNARYAGAFRILCGTFLSREDATRIVRFRASAPGKPLDTEIVLADPRQAPAPGKLKARILGLDSRGVGWVPTALLLSLVLSTPIPWRRRAWALALGLVAVNAYVVVTVAAYIWNESLPPLAASATAVESARAWVAAGLEETLVTQLGASFVVPATIWLLVTFNRSDWAALQGLVGAQPARR